MYRGGSIGYLPEISDSRIFGLPSFLSMLDMGAFHYSLLVPVNETLMHRTRRTDSRTRFRTLGLFALRNWCVVSLIPAKCLSTNYWSAMNGAKIRNGVNLRVLEPHPVIELSRYVVEPLRKDENFILYRGRSKYDASQILVLSPLTEYPAPEILKRLEHEYSLREELNSTWAVRPIAIARHWDRPVLVSEDPGGVPLDQLLVSH